MLVEAELRKGIPTWRCMCLSPSSPSQAKTRTWLLRRRRWV
jgi:hypothetical protein